MFARIGRLIHFKKLTPIIGLLQAAGTTVPSSVSGYAAGCVFHHTDGSAGTALYINEGTYASCAFVSLVANVLSGTATNSIMKVGSGISDKVAFPAAVSKGFAIYMDNTAAAGFTGIRLRTGANPSAGAGSIDNLLAQVSIESGKDATTINCGFFEIIPKGTNTVTTARVLLCNADSAAAQTMTTQIIGHFRVHTRGDETITNDEMLRLENEAVGGNGRQLDSYIRCMATSLSAAIKGADYLIDGGTNVKLLGTALLRVPDDGSICEASDPGDGTAVTASDFAGYITVVVGTTTMYIPLLSGKPTSIS